jgi:hypothetical protein
MNNTTTGGTEMETKTTPAIGMSVSYAIGSDSYHQIIVEIARNGKTIRTAPAEAIINHSGMTLEQWNTATETTRKAETLAAWNQMISQATAYEMSWGDIDAEKAERLSIKGMSDTYTLRQNGCYMTQGANFGYIHLNDQSEYRDPSF